MWHRRVPEPDSVGLRLLDDERLAREDYVDRKPGHETRRWHCDGRCNRVQRLWGMLMFQAWLEANS